MGTAETTVEAAVLAVAAALVADDATVSATESRFEDSLVGVKAAMDGDCCDGVSSCATPLTWLLIGVETALLLSGGRKTTRIFLS